MSLSVVVPAYNEEACLGETLSRIRRSTEFASTEVEMIVVDNDSTDRTASIASAHGARVIREAQRGAGRARNSGAAAATGDVLVFIDADTLVPDQLLMRIREVMRDSACVGGAVDTKYVPRRRVVSLYLEFWRLIGKIAGMAQGAVQFCKREVFVALNGYDPAWWMGEDVDFYWRLRQFGHVTFIDDIRVEPSSRRFDRWPLWRILLWTNPLVIWIFRRRRGVWKAWYDEPIR